MNKLNVPKRDIQKERRNKRANKRRLKSIVGCLKVSLKPNTHTLLNRKQRKLQKKWRLAQKEVLQSGLVTMQDIEMMVVDEEVRNGQVSIEPNSKSLQAFHMKKRAKLKFKNSSKGKQMSEPMVTLPVEREENSNDAMVQ
ncbi:unnamed protein product [Sphagnum jensenii]|uniref:Uncharacterized protein n=1 Tax=Sphagnum jensenii TaxID=128206 RepID=A0ABP1BNI4_9BRYO